MPRFKDYYQVLGIQPRSHVRVIEESYWQQAHELQKQPTRKAARRLGMLNEAYEVLGSPYRREIYDRQMRQHVDDNGSSGGRLLQGLLNIIGKPFRPD